MQEKELRRVEDYFAAERQVQPFAWIEELRRCVFDAAVGSGDMHLCFIISEVLVGVGGKGKEVKVHLRRKPFR